MRWRSQIARAALQDSSKINQASTHARHVLPDNMSALTLRSNAWNALVANSKMSLVKSGANSVLSVSKQRRRVLPGARSAM